MAMRISIPEPCHESWNQMLPGENGRYCRSCEKTVIDFTGQPRAQIEQYLLLHRDRQICGRFHRHDVQTAAIEPVPPVKVSWFRYRWLAFAAAVSAFLFHKKAVASEAAGSNHTGMGQHKNMWAKTGRTVIHGWIRNSEKKGVARAEVRVLSGGKEIAFTRSFANGSYFIDVPENTIWDWTVSLEYNALDCRFTVINDIPVRKDRIKLDVLLAGARLPETQFLITEEHYVLGDIAVEPIAVQTTMGAPMVEMVPTENIYQVPAVPGADSLLPAQEQHAPDFQPAENTLRLRAYPNPGNGLFRLDIRHGDVSALDLLVFDLNGRLLLRRAVGTAAETVDLTQNAPGTYLLLVLDRQTGQKQQVKVVVAR